MNRYVLNPNDAAIQRKYWIANASIYSKVMEDEELFTMARCSSNRELHRFLNMTITNIQFSLGRNALDALLGDNDVTAAIEVVKEKYRCENWNLRHDNIDCFKRVLSVISDTIADVVPIVRDLYLDEILKLNITSVIVGSVDPFHCEVFEKHPMRKFNREVSNE